MLHKISIANWATNMVTKAPNKLHKNKIVLFKGGHSSYIPFTISSVRKHIPILDWLVSLHLKYFT